MIVIKYSIWSEIEGCDGVRAQISAREILDWAAQTPIYAASITTRHPVVAYPVTAPSHFSMAEDHGYSGTSTTTQVPVRNTLVMDHGRYNARLEGRDGVSADGGRRDGRTGAAHLFGCSLASSQSPLNIVKDETAVMAEDEINGFCLKHVVGLEVLPDVDNGAAE